MTGSGTISDPYIIENKADLIAVSSNLAAHYRLGADIDLETPSFTNIWTPIGTEAAPFTGSFNGAGRTINNLFSTNYSTQFQHMGLFGKINTNYEIFNFTLLNPAVISWEYTGGSTPHTV